MTPRRSRNDTTTPGRATLARRALVVSAPGQWPRWSRVVGLIGSPAGIEHAAETHELGLFTPEEMVGAFTAAGFQVEHDAEGITGRGLYVGSRDLPGM